MSATTDLAQRHRVDWKRSYYAEADQSDALRKELQDALDTLTAITNASGSKTNGDVVGHVAALRADAERYALAKTLEGQVVVMETLKNLGASWLDEKLDELAAENDSIDAAMKGQPCANV